MIALISLKGEAAGLICRLNLWSQVRARWYRGTPTALYPFNILVCMFIDHNILFYLLPETMGRS
jgi:hypothetical protein